MHNHEESESPDAHPTLRRLDQQQLNVVASITNAGSSAYSITVNLRHGETGGEENSVRVRDVVNVRQKLRQDLLAGRTPVQTILAELREDSFANNYETDMEGHLTKLFFASPHSLAMFKRYPEVLILDCTYKTNRFKFPLLNMVAVNELGQTFYVAFTFLRSESENDFRWALGKLRTHITHPLNVVGIDRDLALMNAVRGVFPSSTILLCQWHVNKAVKEWVRKYFSRQHEQAAATSDASDFSSDNDAADEPTRFNAVWKGVMKSRVASQFSARWRGLQEEYATHKELLRYLETTWIR
jgi:hypothetical protein